MSDEIKEEIAQEQMEVTAAKPNRIPLIIGGAVIGLLAVGGLAFWYFGGSSGAGQPVSAPRTVTFGDNSQTSTGSPGEQTITIQPDQVDRIGIKIETVGETLSNEAMSVAATGVVSSNAYKETPVFSLLGGVVRKVNAELGKSATKGQTLAVVFSDELAASQSRYIALQTEAQVAKTNYDRTARLVRINPVSNAELDQALAAVTSADADLEEHHLHHLRAEKLLAIGAISREEYEQAISKYKTAEANLEAANKRYQRAVTLADINPVSKSEFEVAAVKLQTAESELATARQRLLLLGMSPQRLDILRSPTQITSEIAIVSPTSGTVTKRDVNVNEVVEANKELMRVTDLSSVWVIAQVYEKDLASIRNGTGASVTSDAYPGRVFRGHVTYIDPNISAETRTAQVRIELDNPGQLLKIGMYVNAAFGSTGTAERTMPVIPSAAVQNLNERQVVFLVTDKPNVFAVRNVRLGKESNGNFTVLEGLNVGDKIVTDGSFLLRAEMLKQDPSRQ